MKAEYKIKIRAIDETGNLTEWSNENSRLKATVTLEYDNGRIRQFNGILAEVTDEEEAKNRAEWDKRYEDEED